MSDQDSVGEAIFCAYCDHKESADVISEDGWSQAKDAMATHMMACEKHPTAHLLDQMQNDWARFEAFRTEIFLEARAGTKSPEEAMKHLMHIEKMCSREMDSSLRAAAHLRPCVVAFAILMEMQLRKRDKDRGERSWKDEPSAYRLFIDLEEDMEDVARLLRWEPTIYADKIRRVMEETADVGNRAMMIADWYGMMDVEVLLKALEDPTRRHMPTRQELMALSPEERRPHLEAAARQYGETPESHEYPWDNPWEKGETP